MEHGAEGSGAAPAEAGVRQSGEGSMGSKARRVWRKARCAFDVEAYLESTGPTRKVVHYRRGDVAFSQVDAFADVRYSHAANRSLLSVVLHD